MGEVTTSYSGGTPDVSNCEYYGDEIPFIRSGEINNFHTDLFITEKGLVNSSAAMVKEGDILYALYGATSGEVSRSKLKGAINQAILAILPKAKYDSEYIAQWLKTKKRYIVDTYLQGGQGNLSGNIVKDFIVDFSSYNEQLRIGNFASSLDHLITLHQRKLEKLKIIKKSMLENLFPQNGEKTPKIRFSGFTEDWEQRKLGEVVVIERGGSPRPIEKYVTESNDGLNWIKIGDAPVQGRYITKTSEKIKKSGLSKTRQVFPGDLILSNSMSFGKPYIMGIEGCIHDGWLVIKNKNNVFDLKFLCHMLSTEYLFNQYKMFAAGSTVNNLNKELVGNASVRFPKMLEQKKIGQYLESLDHLITLHQSKLEKLQKIKKSMLESMFV